VGQRQEHRPAPAPAPGDAYAMGRTEHEARRLQRQAAIHAGHTRRLLAAAGIGPGMTVLDLGSGAGDLALLAAEAVGPTGHVLGVDMNPQILETARRRAAGRANVTFVAGDLRDFVPDGAVDALVGRLILCHLPDPVAVLRRLVPYLRPGGVAAFYDLDFTAPRLARPPSPLADRVFGWMQAALASAGVDVYAGTSLHRIFLDAGLAAPRMDLYALIGGSPDVIEELAAYEAETVRTLLPLLIKAGIATEQEVGIETLAARYRDELVQLGSVVCCPLFVGAWAPVGGQNARQHLGAGG
jgi:SAM-dependent methyltransferase